MEVAQTGNLRVSGAKSVSTAKRAKESLRLLGFLLTVNFKLLYYLILIIECVHDSGLSENNKINSYPEVK